MGCIFCVVGIGGIFLTLRNLGIAEYVAVLWLSALNTATAFYIAGLVKKKIWGLRFIITTFFYIATYFYLLKGGHMNDKVFTGMTVGMETYFVAHFVERVVYKKNGDKNLLPYQRVVFTVAFVVVASLLTVAALK